jgi:hypothetical protein
MMEEIGASQDRFSPVGTLSVALFHKNNLWSNLHFLALPSLSGDSLKDGGVACRFGSPTLPRKENYSPPKAPRRYTVLHSTLKGIRPYRWSALATVRVYVGLRWLAHEEVGSREKRDFDAPLIICYFFANGFR